MASRIEHKKASNRDFSKLNDQMKDFRDNHKDAQVTRKGGEVMLRGRIDDCGDAAKAANDFAGNDCVEKIFVDISCASR
jgi:hypothetical protein